MLRHHSPLHVHDLPQLYQKPTFDALVETLDNLKLEPSSLNGLDGSTSGETAIKVDPEGIPRYLTSIVSSSLSWLEDDTERERVWDLASTRLSERSGRNAMPSMTRAFTVTEELVFKLFEPSLTEDNLGLKTWTSSLLLAKRLNTLREHIPGSCQRVLELGAGTGLVGLAVACSWEVDVTLTDLPEIVTNLKQNVESNSHLTEQYGSDCTVCALDWADDSYKPNTDEERYQVVIAADPIYTAEHPKMLVDTVGRWLQQSSTSRFIVELPLREGYSRERDDLKYQLRKAQMQIVDEGTEIGYDDWQDRDGQLAEVKCWWSIWQPVLSDAL